MSENGNIILPEWFDGKKINEALFCAEFIRDFPMITINDTFFTVNGRVTDENRLKKEIYNRIKPYVTSGIAKRVTGLLDVMRMECCTASLPLFQDHMQNEDFIRCSTMIAELLMKYKAMETEISDRSGKEGQVFEEC